MIKRVLNAISVRIDTWVVKPSIGASGGILFDCDGTKFEVLSSIEHTFTLIIFLKID
jgi:hypothetical protein